MLAIVLCVVAFVVTYWAGRRSLVSGLLTALSVGYVYGIVRANVISPYSHFIFDASLVGLYLSQFTVLLSPAHSSGALRTWIAILIAWPLLVCLLPFQPFLVSLVGLRGNVFFLPVCLLAVRLETRGLTRLAYGLAALNVFALAF